MMISKNLDYSHVEVAGDAIFPVIKAITAEALCKTLLEKNSLVNIQKGSYYPLDKYIFLLRDIEKRMPTVLKKIGEHIMNEAIFPSDISSFEQALMSADQAYLMNHKNVINDEIGHYYYKKLPDGKYLFSVSTLYPCVFTEGIIIGMAKKFETNITIIHTSEQCKSKGDFQCDYEISVYA